ncbi:hypothetical protein FOA52_013793 [Chlamydomonas sp. UWO 241]|nr:hypothetical protein FOA52_013793 [Chlamydomonas sp. UWO 241]
MNMGTAVVYVSPGTAYLIPLAAIHVPAPGIAAVPAHPSDVPSAAAFIGNALIPPTFAPHPLFPPTPLVTITAARAATLMGCGAHMSRADVTGLARPVTGRARPVTDGLVVSAGAVVPVRVNESTLAPAALLPAADAFFARSRASARIQSKRVPPPGKRKLPTCDYMGQNGLFLLERINTADVQGALDLCLLTGSSGGCSSPSSVYAFFDDGGEASSDGGATPAALELSEEERIAPRKRSRMMPGSSSSSSSSADEAGARKPASKRSRVGAFMPAASAPDAAPDAGCGPPAKPLTEIEALRVAKVLTFIMKSETTVEAPLRKYLGGGPDASKTLRMLLEPEGGELVECSLETGGKANPNVYKLTDAGKAAVPAAAAVMAAAGL